MSSNRPCILVVDDEESIRDSFALILQDEYDVIAVSTGEAALKKAVDHKIDLVFLDIRMPGMDGIETLERLKKIDPQIEVIMITAVNDVQKASETVKIGANNYIVKPFDVKEILSIAKAITRKKEILSAAQKIKSKEENFSDFAEFSGDSKSVKNTISKIEQLSKSDTAVMIMGESGTEKISVAKMIHFLSNRKNYPFLIFDIGKNKNENEIAKKLFGSGTGSSVYELDKTIGVLEKCSGGTILINGIHNAPKDLLSKIISLSEGKTFSRIGISQEIKIDIRMLFSTNEDYLGPENLASDSILIPPLRARREDIPDICSKLLEDFNSACPNKIKEISHDAQEILNTYPWPGNFEELKSILFNAYLTKSDKTIKAKNLPLSVLFWSPAFSYIDEASMLSLDELNNSFDREFILKVLKATNFEIQAAAKALGINKNILLPKIETLEIK